MDSICIKPPASIREFYHFYPFSPRTEGDTAYRSRKNEAWLAANGMRSCIRRKKPQGRLMPRRTMLRDNRHDSVHIFDAISPTRGVGAAITMPAANTEAMNENLTGISTQVAADVHCLLACDGAGWHQKGEQLIIPDNITMLPLPPSAPKPNPMENAWGYCGAATC